MLYFASLDDNNVVTNVVIIDEIASTRKKSWWNPIDWFIEPKQSEEAGISFCKSITTKNSKWKQTWSDCSARGNFASPGYLYLEGVNTLGVGSTDIFIQEPWHKSWQIDTVKPEWIPPDDVGEPPELTDEEFDSWMIYTWYEDNYKVDPATAWVLEKWNYIPPDLTGKPSTSRREFVKQNALEKVLILRNRKEGGLN